MSWWRRLLGLDATARVATPVQSRRQAPQSPAPIPVPPSPVPVLPARPDWIEIVGESFYQAALIPINLGFVVQLREEDDRLFPVRLFPDPSNTYDPNAVAVKTLNGSLIGHLRREMAAQYHHLVPPDHVCAAKLIGGTDDKPTIGVLVEFSAVRALNQAAQPKALAEKNPRVDFGPRALRVARGLGGFNVQVVGEVDFQRTLEALHKRIDAGQKWLVADFVLAVDGEMDVAIKTDQHETIGLLSKRDAARYRPVLSEYSDRYDVFWCRGHLKVSASDKPIAVELDLLPPSEMAERAGR